VKGQDIYCFERTVFHLFTIIVDTIGTVGFIKIGEEQNMKSLLERGLLFCNSIKFFREIESPHENLIADKSEGSINSINVKPQQFEFFIGEKKLTVKFACIRKYQFYEPILEDHIYCLFSMRSNNIDKANFINAEISRFGDSAFVITDVAEFMNRVDSALKELNVKFERDHVKYYDKKSDHNKLTVFDKPNEYEPQNEYRLYIKGQKTKTFSFEIGNLKDVALIINSVNLPIIELKREIKNTY